jgi:ribosome-associated protein
VPPGADVFVSPSLTIPAAEIRWRFTASGGPGGQHVNTTNTRATLTWDVESSTALDADQRERLRTELGPVVRVVVSDERSQARNREIAVERLRERVAGALAEPLPRRPTAPTRASVEQRLRAKRLRSEQKAARRDGDLEN